MTVECVNVQCGEAGKVKPCDVTLGPGERVYCGACGKVCEVSQA